MAWQRFVIRIVAISTCLVAIIGLVTTVVIYQRLNQAEETARAQLQEISSSVAQVATSLEAVSAACISAATTVEEAQDSLDSGGAAARGAAEALTQLAQSMALFGLGDSFQQQANQLTTLATELNDTSTALNTNAADLRLIGREVGQSADEIARVAEQLQRFAGPSPEAGGFAQLIDTVRLIVGGAIVLLLFLLFGIGLALYLLTTEAGAQTLLPPTQADSQRLQEQSSVR